VCESLSSALKRIGFRCINSSSCSCLERGLLAGCENGIETRKNFSGEWLYRWKEKIGFVFPKYPHNSFLYVEEDKKLTVWLSWRNKRKAEPLKML